MGKSSSGPGVTDVETLMRAIGSLHSGEVALTFSPLGIGSSGGVRIEASIVFAVLPGSSIPKRAIATGQFPGGEAKTFEGELFGCLYRLDGVIAKLYTQEKLWE